MESNPGIDRRSFLARLPVIPVTVAAVAGVTTGCASVPYVTGRPSPLGVVVPLAAFGEGVDLLAEVPGSRFPIYLRKAEDGAYTAVELRCTHRGCQPDPEADRLTCPCHGSEFAFDGRVLTGPADRPLARHDVEIQGDTLLIMTSEESGAR